MRIAPSATLAGVLLPALSASVAAADLTLNVEIPKLTVAEYHRPYVAIWVERPDQSFVSNLVVWYDLKLKENEGAKWLKDLRQWWRRSGRELQTPVDGLTGATRAPGDHTITFASGAPPLQALPAGDYEMVVEAAREVGGREILRLPFQWPPRVLAAQATQGSHELGAVRLSLKP